MENSLAGSPVKSITMPLQCQGKFRGARYGGVGVRRDRGGQQSRPAVKVARQLIDDAERAAEARGLDQVRPAPAVR